MRKDGYRLLKRVSVRKVTHEKIQRYRCVSCGKRYTFRKSENKRKFTQVFIKEAVKDFIQGRSSFSVIKERKDVSVGTLSTWVNDFGERCMSPVEIARHLKIIAFNRWSGILLLDAKYLNKKMSLLLAVDFLTVDVVAHLVVNAETEENYIKLVDIVEECGYEIEVIISDGDPAIIALTQSKKFVFRKGTRRYPRPGIKPSPGPKARLEGVPHQWCCIHAKWDLTLKLPKLRLKKEEKIHLKKLIHSVLFAKSLSCAKRQMRKLNKTTSNNLALHNQITLWIDERWEMLMLHHTLRVNGRKIPRTSNTVENTISYINIRLKTLRRLRSYASSRSITNLIVVNYRTKPLINTKNKLKRRKSPLNLVTGEKRKFDWMEFIRKTPV